MSKKTRVTTIPNGITKKQKNYEKRLETKIQMHI